MKKVVALIVILALFGLTLMGCSSKTNDVAKKTLPVNKRKSC